MAGSLKRQSVSTADDSLHDAGCLWRSCKSESRLEVGMASSQL